MRSWPSSSGGGSRSVACTYAAERAWGRRSEAGRCGMKPVWRPAWRHERGDFYQRGDFGAAERLPLVVELAVGGRELANARLHHSLSNQHEACALLVAVNRRERARSVTSTGKEPVRARALDFVGLAARAYAAMSSPTMTKALLRRLSLVSISPSTVSVKSVLAILVAEGVEQGADEPADQSRGD